MYLPEENRDPRRARYKFRDRRAVPVHRSRSNATGLPRARAAHTLCPARRSTERHCILRQADAFSSRKHWAALGHSIFPLECSRIHFVTKIMKAHEVSVMDDGLSQVDSLAGVLSVKLSQTILATNRMLRRRGVTKPERSPVRISTPNERLDARRKEIQL